MNGDSKTVVGFRAAYGGDQIRNSPESLASPVLRTLTASERRPLPSSELVFCNTARFRNIGFTIDRIKLRRQRTRTSPSLDVELAIDTNVPVSRKSSIFLGG
ncbi:MAG TPA: hypothetical protein VEL79_06130 [Vicinamibacterales bacterium]|nr:hypothetical protein [Vicinamibacterales bacterium]